MKIYQFWLLILYILATSTCTVGLNGQRIINGTGNPEKKPKMLSMICGVKVTVQTLALYPYQW